MAIAEKRNENGKTFGAVFIKCTLGKEWEITDWIIDRMKDGVCENCQYEEKEKRPCNEIEIVSAAILSGYFDFIMGIHAPSIINIEKFVLSCIRTYLGAKSIMDTQTIAGCKIGLPELKDAFSNKPSGRSMIP